MGICKLISPIVPFISEEIYTNLTGEESVHLADYPEYDEKLIDNTLEEDSKDNNKKGSLDLVSEEIKERVNKKGLGAIYSYLSAQLKEAINNC